MWRLSLLRLPGGIGREGNMEIIPLCYKCGVNPRRRTGPNNKNQRYRAYCKKCECDMQRESRKANHQKTNYSLKNDDRCPSCKIRKIQKNHLLCNQCGLRSQTKQFNAWNKAIYKIEQLNEIMRTDCEFPADFNKGQLERWEIAVAELIHTIEQAREE